jgi:hypothetical protein
MFQRSVLALAGVAAAAALWYFWSGNGARATHLVAEPASVTYDAQERRLTAIVNLQNDGERMAVASITTTVFLDSQKQLSESSKPQTRRVELTPRQSMPMMFVLEGEPAAAVWRGVQLMEVTMDVGYSPSTTLNCTFSFMGRFYPEMKKIGIVSSVTSPRRC